MRIRTVRDLGAFVRGQREAAGWTQQELADRAGVSKRWVAALEHGKAGAEVGLVLRTLGVLGVELDAVAGGRPGAAVLDQLFADLDPERDGGADR